MKTTIEEATDFFEQLFYGNHHIPSEIKSFGNGYSVRTFNSMATFDSHYLTRLVLLAHKLCFRAEIQSSGFNAIKIIIFKRCLDGRQFERHPTIEQALQEFNK